MGSRVSSKMTTYERARKICGKNLIDIQEVSKVLGVKFSKPALKVLKKIPYPESVLKATKNTHLLIAMPKLSILRIRALAPHGTFWSYKDSWYNDEKFAKVKSRLGWLLIRKEAVPNSTSKTYDEQRALLSSDEEVPRAVEVVYAMTLHLLVRGEKLFQKIWARTSSLSSDDRRVYVLFYDGRLNIGGWDGDGRDDGLGLASSRRFPK